MQGRGRQRGPVRPAANRIPSNIIGGTGIYQNAHGDGTIQIPPDVPNQTDANFVLNLKG